MLNTHILLAFSILAAVMLFLHGLAAFSEEISRIGGERLKRLLHRVTRIDAIGALVGALATAVVQSSSAVTSMAVGLAHSKALTERGAFAIMIGANVGTTLTAWLVAMKIEGLGPIFISLGGLWSIFGIRAWRPYGKAVFYFGLIFLALDLIGQGLAPFAQSSVLTTWHALLESAVIAVLFGALLTVIVQSSSVASGLAVLVVAQGIIPPNIAVWIVAGANVGTTTTALLASSALDTVAKKLALLNTAFNVLGVLIFATILQPVVHLILSSSLSLVEQVALVHTTFNLVTAMVALFILPHLWHYVDRWLRKST